MPKTRPPYPAEFRRQMVELVAAGRTPAELSREVWLLRAEHRQLGRKQRHEERRTAFDAVLAAEWRRS